MIQQPWRTVVFDVFIIFNIWNIWNILLNASKFRWASIRGFDWAGELLTLDLPGEPNSVQQTTWHVMVARMRLVLAWAPKPGDLAPRVLDWTLVIPPIIVRSPASADIYYALFHSPHTRPLMLARFVMMQQASLAAVDLSETDDAGANSRLEAHLLSKCVRFPEAPNFLKTWCLERVQI